MKTKSFTLIELLVVIVIIGILAGVITLSVSSNISKAQDLRISSTILSVSKTLKADSYDSFPIETTACNLKNSCTTLKSRIDLPNITEDIYYKTSSSGKFFVLYANKPSDSSRSFEITSLDENVKEVPSFDNLVTYYPLSTGTANGTTISDMSPNSNNGTNYGASSATGVDGNIGTAMSFDGTNDYVNCGNDSSLDITDKITITSWIKINGTGPGAYQGIILNTPASGTYNYGLSISDDDYKPIALFKTNDVMQLKHSTSLELNVWYFLSMTVDSTHIKLRINEIDEVSTEKGTLTNSFTNTTIGTFRTNYFNGSIDDVRIYNRALSQEEVTLLYNAK